READQRRRSRLHVPVQAVRDRACCGGEGDRCEGGAGGGPARETDHDEQGHDDDAAPNAEQRTEDAGDKADREQAHPHIVWAWPPAISSPRSPNGRPSRRSYSTSTGRLHRSWHALSSPPCPTRRARRCGGWSTAMHSSPASADVRERRPRGSSASREPSTSAFTGSSSLPKPSAGVSLCGSSRPASTGRSRTRGSRSSSTTGRRGTKPRLVRSWSAWPRRPESWA